MIPVPAGFQDAGFQDAGFQGRVALVTGAASGIGLAVARAFLERGARVVLADLRLEGARRAADQLGAPGRTLAAGLDVRDSHGISHVVDEAWAAYGIVDVLVNCAGVYPSHAFLEMAERDWDRVLDTNLKGPFLCTRAFAGRLVGAGRPGRVVTISSGAARRARPGALHYCTSKAGVEMLTRALALELADHRIAVNAVAPGFVRVDSAVNPLSARYVEAVSAGIPLRRAGTPGDIAAAVLFLCSASAEWVTGSVLTVDGGSGAGDRSLPPSA
ncbi:MAG: SDR family NAD(P)-dependent oxidoreductase [Carbonactinosporaceae bacterium]